MKKINGVPEILEQARKTFESRNPTYGQRGYLMQAGIVNAMFPEGIPRLSTNDMGRFVTLMMITAKLGRYATNFLKGGHKDSIHDLGVYAFILEEFDDAINADNGSRRKPGKKDRKPGSKRGVGLRKSPRRRNNGRQKGH